MQERQDTPLVSMNSAVTVVFFLFITFIKFKQVYVKECSRGKIYLIYDDKCFNIKQCVYSFSSSTPIVYYMSRVIAQMGKLS